MAAPRHTHKLAEYEDNPSVAATESGGPPTSPGVLISPKNYKYEVVPGFFHQTEGVKDGDEHFKHFGLIDTSPERWSNLRSAVQKLQSQDPKAQYKLLILGRHGQGWHNFASSKYGHDPWECKWTFLTGDGEITWGPDPELTPLGHEQTLAHRVTWAEEEKVGAPISEREMAWYSSPLRRTCQTFLNTWGEKPAEIWEDFREIYGSHTCDKRSTRTEIAQRFPHFKIEDGFTEEDELWRPDDRETDEHMQIRMTRAMDRLFDTQEKGYVSITGHGAIFRNLLAVLGHKPYPFATGEVIPILVKATRQQSYFAL